MDLDIFDPGEDEDEFSAEYDDFGKPIMDKNGQQLPKGSVKDIQFEKEKQENIAANDKLRGRREKMAPYIEKFREIFLAIFHQNPQPADLYTALELLYDWTLGKLESSMNKTYEEASQWMRVANDLIDIDEYALMESVEDMITSSPHSAIRATLEQQYNNLLKAARGEYSKEAQIFIEIAFALVSIVEEQIEKNPNDAEDYIELKDTIDSKYGPLFKGLQNQLNDLASKDRRYGRVAAR
jgi:hypothetical protein